MRARVLHGVGLHGVIAAFHFGTTALALALCVAGCADDDACAAGRCDPPVRDASSDARTDADSTLDGECEPNEQRSCYSGPRGTRDEGACRAGTRTCSADGDGFGPCEGEVVPAAVDDCDNDTDDDCNGVVNDGLPRGVACECMPGDRAACYTGPSGTQDVGPCHAGTRVCEAEGRGFGACEDEQLPVAATCSNADDDCNGAIDGDQDLDGDSVTPCDGDCCDSPLHDCPEPWQVNPAAFDFPNNGVDEDCSGQADEPRVSCDAALASDSPELRDYARALDLCALADGQTQHGFLSLVESLADGTGSPLPVQRSLRPDFGAITPRVGESMVVLSTGHAADTTDLRPAYAQGSTSLMTTSDAPADWLVERFGMFPSLPGCDNGPSTSVFDPIMLTLRVRAPSNAHAFALDAYFLSTEYPEWVCTDYFDLFVALLDSSYAGRPKNPDDMNLASFIAEDELRYGVSVNLAQSDSGLLRACQNGEVGCLGDAASTTSACLGVEELAGTGMEIESGGCTGNAPAGAGTGWFRIAGNIVPGETFELRIALWDAGDSLSDSLVLLDGFTWLKERVTPGISP
jgi:hypothetical protein